LIKLWTAVSSKVTINTEPQGAEVFWKDYDKPDTTWRWAGITPLKDVRMPRGYLRIQLRKNNYQTIEYSGPQLYERLGAQLANVKMDKTGSLPENMVRIAKAGDHDADCWPGACGTKRCLRIPDR